MKTLLYIPLLLAGLLLATTLSAQEEKCPLRPFEFDPNIVQRDVPNPELDTTPIPLGKGTGKFRKIYWVHGMQGNSGSWSRAVEYTQKNWASFAETRSLDYQDAQNSLSTAAAHLNSQGYFPAYTSEDTFEAQEMKKDFLIAHSMGGLVSRYLDKHFNENPDLAKPFGGLITFGTPHTGAELARLHVFFPHVVEHFVKQSCHDLLGGPTKELILDKELFRALEAITFKTNIGNTFKDIACEKIADVGLKIVSDQFVVRAEEDMVPNSGALQAIANVPYKGEHLHTLAFFGEEFDEKKDGFGSGDMAIRFLFSATKNPNDYPMMRADSMDEHALNEASEMLSFYQEKRDHWNMKSKQIGGKYYWFGFNPAAWPWIAANQIYLLIEAHKTAQAYEKGITWFSLLNERWKFMMGAKQIVQEGEKKCFCNCPNPEPPFQSEGYQFMISYSVPCDKQLPCLGVGGNPVIDCAFTEEINYVVHETKSDGLVTKESAMALPNLKHIPQKMLGSGHFQMRNDTNLEIELNKTFSGFYNKYFKLEK